MVFLVFWDSIPKWCKGVHCVDLGESFPKFGFDTAENEPCKICPLSAYRSPRFISHGKCRLKWYKFPNSSKNQFNHVSTCEVFSSVPIMSGKGRESQGRLSSQGAHLRVQPRLGCARRVARRDEGGSDGESAADGR